jgi:hypothetical protein
MSRIARRVATAIAILVGLCVIYLTWAFISVNSWIDMCADNSSPSYIADDAARAEACKDR